MMMYIRNPSLERGRERDTGLVTATAYVGGSILLGGAPGSRGPPYYISNLPLGGPGLVPTTPPKPKQWLLVRVDGSY